jgi:5-methylcytosine-specific restriction endonuclease McrA
VWGILFSHGGIFMLPFNSNGTMKKICASCLKLKPISEFYKDARSKDGLYTRCKKCHSKSTKKWQESNAEKFKEDNMKWKNTHKKQRNEQNKKWARAHPEKRRKTFAAWRNKNPEYGKNWRKNNKEKIRHYAQNRRARVRGNGGELTVEEWNAVLDFYGYQCLCCGKGDVKLTIDHVIPIFQGGKYSVDNVQPLCGPCNSRKKDKTIDYRKEYYHASPRD